MHLLQVSPYVVHPPRTGGDHRAHGLVTAFPDAGDRVTRYCQGGSSSLYRALDFRRTVEVRPNYGERRHLNPLHDVAKLPMLFDYPNVWSDRALRIASGPLDGLLADADVVLGREPWVMPAVLDRAPDDTPVVFSSHNVEAERFDGAVPSLLGARAYDRVLALERQAVDRADAVVCTGARDEQVYRDRYRLGDTPTIRAPNGTYEDDLRNHDPDSDAAADVRVEYGLSPDATVCTFVGSDYGPNVEAARRVVEMAAELEDREPSVQFLIVGSVGNGLKREPDNVTVTGFVDRFEAHFDATDIALNPMLSGAGSNIKLLDYFARSLPVVSTPFGLRGFEITADEEVVVADIEAFPAAIERLCERPAERERLGRAARELAAERYTWEATSRRLRERLVDLFL